MTQTIDVDIISRTKLNKLENDFINKKQEIIASKLELQDQRKRIAIELRDLNAEKQRAHEELKQRSDQFEREKRQEISKIRKDQQTLLNRMEEYEIHIDRVNECETENAEKSTRIDELQNQLRQVQNDFDTHVELHQSVNIQRNDLLNERKKLEECMQKLTSEQAQSLERSTHLKSKLADGEKAFVIQQEKCDKLFKEHKALEDERNQLRTQLNIV